VSDSYILQQLSLLLATAWSSLLSILFSLAHLDISMVPHISAKPVRRVWCQNANFQLISNDLERRRCKLEVSIFTNSLLNFAKTANGGSCLLSKRVHHSIMQLMTVGCKGISVFQFLHITAVETVYFVLFSVVEWRTFRH